MADSEELDDTRRLETLWGGEFGDAWTDRNIDNMYGIRKPVWDAMLARMTPRPQRVLEVGVNVGGNLRWIAPELTPGNAYGVDINRHALDLIHDYVPDANVLVSSVTDLPFKDDFFDLVFSVGVLVAVPDDGVGAAMAEMARCSSRYVLFLEMYAPELTVIDHREIHRGLFKRDYEKAFPAAVPGVPLVGHGFLSKEEGFDSLDWWLFDKHAKV